MTVLSRVSKNNTTQEFMKVYETFHEETHTGNGVVSRLKKLGQRQTISYNWHGRNLNKDPVHPDGIKDQHNSNVHERY